MKLIIDIPYEAYYIFKCDLGKGKLNALAEIVANGTPYEERPQGEWIYDESKCNWKCSECGETPKTIGYCGNREFMTEHFKYCNHCGADMKGGAE